MANIYLSKVIDAIASQSYVSETITVSGVSSGTVVTAIGCTLLLNNVDTNLTSVAVSDGNTISLKVTASASAAGHARGRITIGANTYHFLVITRASDRLLEDPAFYDKHPLFINDFAQMESNDDSNFFSLLDSSGGVLSQKPFNSVIVPHFAENTSFTALVDYFGDKVIMVEKEIIPQNLKIINNGITDGIYTVQAANGVQFPAYVNNTYDGGGWILIVTWTSSPNKTITFADVCVKDNYFSTYTNNSGTYPVPPTGTILNDCSEIMFVSGNTGWNNKMGTWTKWNMFDNGVTVIGGTTTGFAATNQKVGATTLWTNAAGWYNNAYAPTATFSIWPDYGNGGLCGGANVCGSLCCPITAANYSYSCHFDFSSRKYLFVRY